MAVGTEAPGLLTVSLVAAAMGVTSHLAYFIHGEHHRHSLRYLIIFTLAPVLLFVALARLTHGVPYVALAKVTAAATYSYFAALIASMFTYRAFFHPLRNFPGPPSYRLSKLCQVASLVKDSDNFAQAEQLRQKYGDFVRVGPNELNIFTGEGIAAIAGLGSSCLKAPWYDGSSLPFPNLHSIRDRALHDKRRKTWDRGFSAKALRDYESRVVKYSLELMSQLTSFSGKPFNASLWLNFYSFDVMGDLAFGKSFDMLQSGKRHHILEILAKGMAPIGIFTPLPWAFPILLSLPKLADDILKFVKFGNDQVALRKQFEPEKPDILTWLIDAEKNHPDPVVNNPLWLMGDSRLIIVAGSDTTAATLTYATYHLAKAPDVVARIREELQELNYSSGPEGEARDIQYATYLNGVINETLRLHPAVPSGVLRQTPPEGITIEGTFIPGGVTVSAPLYSMGRLESCFKHAAEFIPERWGEKPELVLNKAAFAPFGGGAYSCVGKQLALMEVRDVIARIVTQFDIDLAPGEDGTNLLTKSRDVFTVELAPLSVVFTLRK